MPSTRGGGDRLHGQTISIGTQASPDYAAAKQRILAWQTPLTTSPCSTTFDAEVGVVAAAWFAVGRFLVGGADIPVCPCVGGSTADKNVCPTVSPDDLPALLAG